MIAAKRYICPRIESDRRKRTVQTAAFVVGFLSTTVLYTAVLRLFTYDG